MIRNIKVGFAFAVAFAAMSMAAVAAQASQLHVNTTAGKAIITGEQTEGIAERHKFQITSAAGGPTVQCGQGHFEGTVEGPQGQQITVQELTITARYTACNFLGLAATVTMNGCKYTFTNTVPTTALTQVVDITGCTPLDTNQSQTKKKIEVHVPGCTLTIPEQHNLSHVVFQNQSNGHVKANATVSGITYETHGAACAHQPETVLKHDATYHGRVTLTGFAHNGVEQVTHNGHQYNKGIAGGSLNLLAT